MTSTAPAAGTGPRPLLNRRLAEFGTTIFAEMSALALRTGSINLGQGFPETDGPEEIREAAVRALRDGRGNQYPPGPGVPELRTAVADHQRRRYALDHDPDTEVLVTAGATEAIAAALLALVEPGDEVIALEPYYDSYAACIAMAGATRVPVTLRPAPAAAPAQGSAAPDAPHASNPSAPPGAPVPRGSAGGAAAHRTFRLDLDELRDAVTDRTRLLLLNTPHNPTGTVLTRAELAEIARLAVERDLLVVTDEVYEHLVFDGAEHIPLATFPGMRERTVTIGSAGKTFSFTGWKVGWATGSAELVTAVRAAKQFLTYVASGPFQYAAAEALALPDSYFEGLRDELQAGRDLLAAGLADAGFEVYRPTGTYFVTTDIRPLGESDGFAFCRALPERVGVVAIPNAVFYDHREMGAPYVRFAFCKRKDTLAEAVTRLGRLAP
ncbi:aminotransferase [Streptomyces sulfonofaciens]|uniref:Aminotransferase n=2 Tax=Streptomyces sulfonofaciens TaxID=68272 RepID=A0A919KRL1_9ACTN|nr:aminotransferase [Streptomyces sulfonofaciens]